MPTYSYRSEACGETISEHRTGKPRCPKYDGELEALRR